MKTSDSTPSKAEKITEWAWKIISALLVVITIAFPFSNCYWVPEGMVAVQSFFGILSSPEKSVRLPGGPYFAPPFPAGKVTRYPTVIRRIDISRAFSTKDMRNDGDDSATVPRAPGAFVPGVHGSIITGDKNIVEGAWTVNYRITSSSNGRSCRSGVLLFAGNIGSMEKADRLVAVFAERAIVEVAAGMPVSDFVAGHIDNGAIKKIIQQQMDSAGSGITVDGVSASYYGPPTLLENDFQAAAQAESEKALQIEKAIRYRTTTLNEVAGNQWHHLLETINASETGAAKGSSQEARVMLEDGSVEGVAGTIIENARTHKTETIEKSRWAASRFNELFRAYRRDPHVCTNQLFQDALHEVLTGPLVKVKWVLPGQRLYIGDIEEYEPE